MKLPFPLGATALGLAVLAAVPAVQAQTTVNHTKVINGTVIPGSPAGYPLRLTQPGHYVLKSDLQVPPGTVGIAVAADNVTIDLNGFTLKGNVQCARYANQPDAVTCYDSNGHWVFRNHHHGISSNRIDTVVRNGRIKGFTGHGVWSLGAITLENVIVGSNAGSGVVVGHVSTRSSRLSGVTAESNAFDGVEVKNALIERSVFSSNGRHGILAEETAVMHSVARRNLGRGIEASATSTLLGTTMFGNAGGATSGSVISLGANSDGIAPF